MGVKHPRNETVNLDLAKRLESDIDQSLARNDFDRAEEFALQYVARAEQDPGLADGAHSPLFRARWLAAQVALAAGDLDVANRRLGELEPLPADLPSALGWRITLAKAEVPARRKDVE